MIDQKERLIGAGLLRLFADTFILVFKMRCVYWGTNGGNRSAFSNMIQEQYAGLDESLDKIATRLVAKQFAVPSSCVTLAAMSSVKADHVLLDALESTRTLVDDHEKILNDIETLRAMMPLEGDDETSDLLGAASKFHSSYRDKLVNFLALIELMPRN